MGHIDGRDGWLGRAGRVYDIEGVAEVGRREGLELTASAVRPEA